MRNCEKSSRSNPCYASPQNTLKMQESAVAAYENEIIPFYQACTTENIGGGFRC